MRLFARVAVYALLSTPFAFALATGCGGSGNSGSASSSTQSAGSNSGGSSSTSSSTNSAAGGAGGNGTSTSSTSTSAGSGGPPTQMAPCQGKFYECGDLVDNDTDGLLDSQDPDCLGACDNTEGNYYGGIPGQAGPACVVDCYFDQDSGAGNDNCYWDHRCAMNGAETEWWLDNKCEYNANTTLGGQTCTELFDAQSQTCYDFCGPLVPNGCDCFGCCELPAGSGSYVWLGSEDGSGNGTCSIDGVADPKKCAPCVPVKACLNDCGACEVCIGKPTPGPECGGGGTGGSDAGAPLQCTDGSQPCGLEGQAECPLNYYCVTGCCRKIPT